MLAVQFDPVAFAHHGQGPSCGGFWRNVQHHSAIGRATHARVGDAHHVGDTLGKQLGRQPHVAHLGHAGITLGPAILHHQDRVGVHIQVWVVDAGLVVLEVLEDHGAPPMLHQRRRGRRRLEHCALGRQVAPQDADTAVGHQGFVQRADDVLIVKWRGVAVVPQAFTVCGQRSRVGQQPMLPEAPDHGRQTAGVIELLHQETPRRLQVDQRRRTPSHARPVLQLQVHANAPGDGFEVDDGVGGATNGGVHSDGIFEGFAGEDFRQPQVFAHHVHDAHARQVRQHVTARVHGRDGGVVRQRSAQRLSHAGHGRSRAHGVAGAG